MTTSFPTRRASVLGKGFSSPPAQSRPRAGGAQAARSDEGRWEGPSRHGRPAAQTRTGAASDRRERHHRGAAPRPHRRGRADRSEEHTYELQSLMRITYAVFGLKKKNTNHRS